MQSYKTRISTPLVIRGVKCYLLIFYTKQFIFYINNIMQCLADTACIIIFLICSCFFIYIFK